LGPGPQTPRDTGSSNLPAPTKTNSSPRRCAAPRTPRRQVSRPSASANASSGRSLQRRPNGNPFERRAAVDATNATEPPRPSAGNELFEHIHRLHGDIFELLARGATRKRSVTPPREERKERSLPLSSKGPELSLRRPLHARSGARSTLPFPKVLRFRALSFFEKSSDVVTGSRYSVTATSYLDRSRRPPCPSKSPSCAF